MFGLQWAHSRATVRARFDGMDPSADTENALIWPTDVLSDRLFTEDAFLPTAMSTGPGPSGKKGHEAVFNFIDDKLVAICIGFGFPFEMIGQNPDTLGDQAMAAFARAEMALLLHEMAARYGLPGLITEGHMRQGRTHLVMAAHYVLDDGTPISVSFGHDGGALVGELRYLSPAEQTRGV